MHVPLCPPCISITTHYKEVTGGKGASLVTEIELGKRKLLVGAKI